MGFRYRKSINLGGGFKVNVSKTGIGYSWGTKGFRITKTAKGNIRKTYSIPKTGISFVSEKTKMNVLKNNIIQEEAYKKQKEAIDEKSPSIIPTIIFGIFTIICIIIAIVYIALTKKMNPPSILFSSFPLAMLFLALTIHYSIRFLCNRK